MNQEHFLLNEDDHGLHNYNSIGSRTDNSVTEADFHQSEDPATSTIKNVESCEHKEGHESVDEWKDGVLMNEGEVNEDDIEDVGNETEDEIEDEGCETKKSIKDKNECNNKCDKHFGKNDDDVEEEDGEVWLSFASSGGEVDFTRNTADVLDDHDQNDNQSTLYVDHFQPHRPSMDVVTENHMAATNNESNQQLSAKGGGITWLRNRRASLGSYFNNTNCSSPSPSPSTLVCGSTDSGCRTGKGPCRQRLLTRRATMDVCSSNMNLSYSSSIQVNAISDKSKIKTDDDFAKMEAQYVGSQMELAKANQVLEESRFQFTRQATKHSQLLIYTKQLEEQETLANETCTSMKQQYDDISKNYAELKTIVAKLREDRVLVVQELREAQARIEDTKLELSRHQIMLIEKESKLLSAEEDRDFNIEQLDDTKKERDEWRSKFHEVNEVLDLMKDEANRSSYERNDLSKQLKRCEQQLLDVRKVSICRAELNEELEDQLCALREQLTMEQNRREEAEEKLKDVVTEHLNNASTRQNKESATENMQDGSFPSSSATRQKTTNVVGKMKFSWIANLLFPSTTSTSANANNSRNTHSNRTETNGRDDLLQRRQSSSGKETGPSSVSPTRKMQRKQSHESFFGFLN